MTTFINSSSKKNYSNVHQATHIFEPAKPLLQGEIIRLKPTTNKIEKVPLPLPISLVLIFFMLTGIPSWQANWQS